jgi:hypothetical protein
MLQDCRFSDTQLFVLELFSVINENAMTTSPSNIDDVSILAKCSEMLASLMLFSNRKYYIPGETNENARLRLRAIDFGVLEIMVHLWLKTTVPELKTNIQTHMLDRIDEWDIDYYFSQDRPRPETSPIDKQMSQEVEEWLKEKKE